MRPQNVDGDLAIPDSLGSPVELEHEGRTATLRLLGASGDVDVDGVQASFDGAMPGVDVSYVARPYGVKETLVLASRLSPRSFAYELRASGLWAASMDRGDVVLKDSAGVERYRVSAPLAWDSAADPAFTNALALSVSKVADGRWRVTLRPDAEWLADPARVYPVSIDPDFSWSNGTTHFNGAQDCYLSGNTQAGYTFCAQSYLQTGWYNRPYRSMFKFDIASAIPAGATVSAAQFKAFAPPATPHIAMGHSLHTITSDWDSTATWNNRKPGTPWTTAGGGGDISTNPAYTSTSTSVQAYNAWYSWNAPIATVQGWVNGTLPNYGLMLRSDNTGNIGNAYVWASTEASTSSQFPADSTKWPSLDVTWSAGDTSPPAAPSDLRIADYDPGRRTANLEFDEGADAAPPGVAPSGVDHSEVRVALRGGGFTPWTPVADSEYQIVDVFEGDQVIAEVRTRDVTGNVSPTAQKIFASLRPADATLEDESNYEFAEQYGVPLAVADTWLDKQDAAINAIAELGGGADARIAGGYFDNEQRKFYLQTLGAPSSEMAEALARHGVSDVTVTESVPYSRTLLDARAGDLAQQFQALVASGALSITVSRDLEGVRLFVTPEAHAANLAALSAASSSIGVPVFIHVVAQPTPETVNQAAQCATDRTKTYDLFNGEAANVSYRVVGCSGAVRGGTEIRRPYVAGNDPESDPGTIATCTGGITATSPSKKTAYLLTAGHCFSEKPLSTRGTAWQDGEWAKTGGGSLGPSNKLVYDPGNSSDLTDAGAIKLTHLSDDDKLKPIIYKSASRPKVTLKGRTSLSDPYTKTTDFVPGRMLCVWGSRKSSAAGSSCGELLDVYVTRPATLDPPQASSVGVPVHRVLINSCRTRGGDSGAPVVTRTTNKIAALHNGSTHQDNIPIAEDTDDGIQDGMRNSTFFSQTLQFMRRKSGDRVHGVRFARCYDASRSGVIYGSPITEVEKRLNVRVLNRSWPAKRSSLDGVRVSVVADSRVARVNVAVWDAQGNWDTVYDPGASRPGVPGLRLPHLLPTDPSDDPMEAFDTSDYGKPLGVRICYMSGRGAVSVDAELTDPDGDVRTIERGLSSLGQVIDVGATPSAGAPAPPPGSPVASGAWCNSGANANPYAGSCNSDTGIVAGLQALVIRGDGVSETALRVDPDGGNASTIAVGGPSTSSATWSPDRRRIVALWSDGAQSVHPSDPGLSGRISSAVDLGNGSQISSPIACSPDGTMLAHTADSGNLEVLDLASGSVSVVATGAFDGVSWSPDGARLTFAWTAPSDEIRIATVRPDGSEFKTLSATGLNDRTPRWLPDSKHVAFYAESPSGPGFWGMKSVEDPVNSCRRLSGAVDWYNQMDVGPGGMALMWGTGFPEGAVRRLDFSTGSSTAITQGSFLDGVAWTVRSWGGTLTASDGWSPPTGQGTCS